MVTNSKKELRTELKQEEFIQSFISNIGNVSECCKQVGMHRNTFELWKNDKEFMTRLREKIDSMDDKIEQKIYEIAEKGDKDLLKFYASRKLKHRGWTERTELEHSAPKGISINLIETSVEDIKESKK